MDAEHRERMASDVLDQILRNHWNEEPPPGLQGRILAGMQHHMANRRRLWTGVLSAAACAALLVLALPVRQETARVDRPTFAGEVASAKSSPKIETSASRETSFQRMQPQGIQRPALAALPRMAGGIDELPRSYYRETVLKVINLDPLPETSSEPGSLIVPLRGMKGSIDSAAVGDLNIEPLGISPAAVAPLSAAFERADEDEPWIGGL